MALESRLHKSETHKVTVTQAEDGRRLDAFLASGTEGLSRTRLKQLIQDGHITGSDGSCLDPSMKVRSGQTFSITVPASEDAVPVAQNIDLTIVFEDDDVIVIDKPAGMVVHPAAGNPDGTLVNALLAHCGDSLSGIGGVKRPGIVHRIDKDTSGLMVVAKNDIAHQSLSRQFAEHSLDRAYGALVWGVPNPGTGRIDLPIGRSPKDRKKMAVRASGGKSAVTHYRTERIFAGTVSLVECRLETGRTHQIRVHMSHTGHPLLGDPVYSRAQRRVKRAAVEMPLAVHAFSRQALHAKLIGFEHPKSLDRMIFSADYPQDINGLIDVLDTIK